MTNIYDLNITFPNIIIDNVTSFKEICEVNQYRALESVQHYPLIVVWFSVALFIILFIYILFSAFIKNSEFKLEIQERIIGLSMLISSVLLFFIILMTYPNEMTGNYIQIAILFMMAFLLISIYYSKVKK